MFDSLCPVCSHQLISESDRIEGVTCELTEKCSHCNQYLFTFAYGHTEIWIGDEQFEYSYTISPAEHNAILDRIKLAETKARQSFQS